jgi:gluconolactonase
VRLSKQTSVVADPCPPIDPLRTALIIQDVQNDAIHEQGAFSASGSPLHAKSQNVVSNLCRLTDACRKRGVIVIHVWFVCDPGYPAVPRNAPLFHGLFKEHALLRGSWGPQPIEGLESSPGDLVVEKVTMSAWENGVLQAALTKNGCDTIINTGVWTNMSVEHTARTGADKGYRVILPEDACSTMNQSWHEASVNFAMRNVATVTSVDDLLAVLQESDQRF